MTSGQNVSITKLPPGISRLASQYSSKGVWWDCNMIRWRSGVPSPVGGWVTAFDSPDSAAEPVRCMLTWRDNQFQPWLVYGNSSKLYAVNMLATPYTPVDITPTDLLTSPSTTEGFGAGPFGKGAFGKNEEQTAVPTENYWQLATWGEDLLAVHSYDGRLFRWSPSTPNTPAAAVPNAPTDNATVGVTDERFCFLLGGKGNGRKVRWCSQEDLDVWTPTATNSAGGFDLQTTGIISTVAKVPQGLLVLTDTDVHLIEYVGITAGVYGRRLISKETGIVGPYAHVETPNGVMFAGTDNFWIFNNGLSVVPCTLVFDVFRSNNRLSKFCHMGKNEEAQEVWFFYNRGSSNNINSYVNFSYGQTTWWSRGTLRRTAWTNPIWQARPYAFMDHKCYEHEVGWLDDGLPRAGIFLETGAIEIGAGDNRLSVDRVYPDTIYPTDNTPYSVNTPVPYTLTLKMTTAPQSKITSYGPITMDAALGYTTMRASGRAMAVRFDQSIDQGWALGDVRVRIKQKGKR